MTKNKIALSIFSIFLFYVILCKIIIHTVIYQVERDLQRLNASFEYIVPTYNPFRFGAIVHNAKFAISSNQYISLPQLIIRRNLFTHKYIFHIEEAEYVNQDRDLNWKVSMKNAEGVLKFDRNILQPNILRWHDEGIKITSIHNAKEKNIYFSASSIVNVMIHNGRGALQKIEADIELHKIQDVLNIAEAVTLKTSFFGEFSQDKMFAQGRVSNIVSNAHIFNAADIDFEVRHNDKTYENISHLNGSIRTKCASTLKPSVIAELKDIVRREKEVSWLEAKLEDIVPDPSAYQYINLNFDLTAKAKNNAGYTLYPKKIWVQTDKFGVIATSASPFIINNVSIVDGRNAVKVWGYKALFQDLERLLTDAVLHLDAESHPAFSKKVENIKKFVLAQAARKKSDQLTRKKSDQLSFELQFQGGMPYIGKKSMPLG